MDLKCDDIQSKTKYTLLCFQTTELMSGIELLAENVKIQKSCP